jgi:diaminopimelate epimerase
MRDSAGSTSSEFGATTPHAAYPQAGLRFRKMHGLGNSFVVLDEVRAGPHVGPLPWHKLAARILSKSFGIGADQLLIARRGAAGRFEMLIFNPDGSSAGMCGNGVRCLARYLVLENLIPASTTTISFDVSSRQVICELFEAARQVRVDMGRPELAPEKVPLRSKSELVNAEVELAGERRRVTAVSMSNPHAVLFMDDVAKVAIEQLGPQIENDVLFPDRCNVEFVQVLSREKIRVRVWERGTGVTEACGSGACASAVAAVLAGYCERKQEVQLPGGVLEIEWRESDQHVLMKGPTASVAEGTFDPEFLNQML